MDSLQSTAKALRGTAAQSQHIGVEVMDIAVPGNEVSRRRLVGSDLVRGMKKIRVVHADGSCGDGFQSKVEVAEQPRLHQ